MNSQNNVLQLQGQLLLTNGLDGLKNNLSAFITQCQEQTVYLDLGYVEAIDTAAMQLLLSAKRTAALQGKLIKLSNVSIMVQDYALLVGLEAVFPELCGQKS